MQEGISPSTDSVVDLHYRGITADYHDITVVTITVQLSSSNKKLSYRRGTAHQRHITLEVKSK